MKSENKKTPSNKIEAIANDSAERFNKSIKKPGIDRLLN